MLPLLITFAYPIWFIALCLLLGGLVSFALYYKDKTFDKKLLFFLSCLRFFSISIITFLLLEPLIKTEKNEIEKPIIIIGVDNSASIKRQFSKKDSLRFISKINQLKKKLSKDYDVKSYAIGSSSVLSNEFDFAQKATNLSEFFNTIDNTYSNQNIGGIVLASDGIYNQGSNPYYSSSQTVAPIFCIALGDTTQKKDLVLEKVKHNSIVYLKDQFLLLPHLSAYNLKGKKSSIIVSEILENNKTKLIAEQKFNIDSDNLKLEKKIIISTKKEGLHHYRININSIKGEFSTQNNSQDVFIEVLDGREKILILGEAPHPDISCIKNAIESNNNFSVEFSTIKDFDKSIATYNLVVLHGLPSTNNLLKKISVEIAKEKIATWFILNNSTNYPLLNKTQSLINLKMSSAKPNEVTNYINPNFNLFSLSANTTKALSDFPPVFSPFGDYKLGGNASSLLFQKIGSVQSNYPLLVLGEMNGSKYGVFCGEGIWKWRLYNYLQNDNHDAINELITKTVQYLSIKADKRKFRIKSKQKIFNENEVIQFEAELYNENFELINEPEINLSLKNESGENFPYKFNRSQNNYELSIGQLAAGTYEYEANVIYNNKKLQLFGKLIVKPLNLESIQTVANHKLLSMLSKKYDGKLFPPNQIDDIANAITTNQNIKPLIFSSFDSFSLLHLKWLFFLIILLFVAEWGFRKWHGGY